MHETQSERTWMGSILNEVQQQYSRPSPVANTSLKSHPLALIRRRSQSWPGAIKAIPNCFSNATYLNEGRLAVPFLVPARPPPALRCAVLCCLSRLEKVILFRFHLHRQPHEDAEMMYRVIHTARGTRYGVLISPTGVLSWKQMITNRGRLGLGNRQLGSFALPVFASSWYLSL